MLFPRPGHFSPTKSPGTGCWWPRQIGLGRVCYQGLPTAYPQPLREKGEKGGTVSYYLEGGYTRSQQGKASCTPFLHLYQMKTPLLHTVSISTSSTHPTRAEQEMVFPMSQKLEIPQDLKKKIKKKKKSLSAGTFCKESLAPRTCKNIKSLVSNSHQNYRSFHAPLNRAVNTYCKVLVAFPLSRNSNPNTLLWRCHSWTIPGMSGLGQISIFQ